MGRLSRNYMYNLIYQILVLISPIITLPYLSRVLGANYLGVSNYVLTVSSVFTTLGLLGFQNYSIREIAYNKNDKNKLETKFYELYLTRLFLGIITIVIYVIYVFFSKYPYLMWIQIFYVIALFIDPCWFYIGIEDMGKAVFRNFIAKIISVIAIFVLVKNNEDYTTYIFLLSFVTCLASILVIPYIWKYFHIELRIISFKTIFLHINASLKLFWPQVAIVIYMSADKILLENLVSSSSVAYYDQAEKMVKIPLTFITVLSTVMMPRLSSYFSEGNREQLHISLSKTIKFSMFIAFPMFFGIIGISSNLIPWYLGPDFLEVTRAIWFISPIVVLVALLGISGDQYLVATNNTKILTVSYSIAALVNVILDILLISKYSVVGAAIGTVFAYLTSLLIQYSFLLKRVYIWKDLINSFTYFFKSIPMFVVMIILSKIIIPSWQSTIVQIILGTVIYIITLLLVRDDIIEILFSKIKNYKFF